MRKILTTLILVGFATFSYAQIIYVNDDAGGTNDGTSWANAYFSLKTALDSSKAGDTIVVAAGTYIPDSSNRYTSFIMKDSTWLFGGFAGNESINSTTIANRDFITNETILSGDLNGDDYSGGSNAENSIHVFFHYATATGPLPDGVEIDGVTIAGGNSNDNGWYLYMGGGGICNVAVTAADTIKMTIRNTTFRDNSSISSSYSSCIYDYVSYGAIYLDVENTRFCDNEKSIINTHVNGNAGAPGSNNSNFIHCNFTGNRSGAVMYNSIQTGVAATSLKTKVINSILYDNLQEEHWSSHTSRVIQYFNCVKEDDFNTRSVDSGSNYIGDVLLADTSQCNDTLYSISPAINRANNIYGYGANSGIYQGSGVFTPLSIDDLSGITLERCPDMQGSGYIFDTVNFSILAQDTNGVTINAWSDNNSLIDPSNLNVIGSGGHRGLEVIGTTKQYGSAKVYVEFTSTSAEKDTTYFNVNAFTPPIITNILIIESDTSFPTGIIEVTVNGTSPFYYYLDTNSFPYYTEKIYNLSPDTHTLYVMDSAGCVSADTSFFVPAVQDTTNTGMQDLGVEQLTIVHEGQLLRVVSDKKINQLDLYSIDGRLINSKKNDHVISLNQKMNYGVIIVHTNEGVYRKKIKL